MVERRFPGSSPGREMLLPRKFCNVCLISSWASRRRATARAADLTLFPELAEDLLFQRLLVPPFCVARSPRELRKYDSLAVYGSTRSGTGDPRSRKSDMCVFIVDYAEKLISRAIMMLCFR